MYPFLEAGAGVMFVTAAWSLAFHRPGNAQTNGAAFGDLKWKGSVR